MIVLTKAVALRLRAFGKPVSHEKAQKHQHFGAKKIRATRLINRVHVMTLNPPVARDATTKKPDQSFWGLKFGHPNWRVWENIFSGSTYFGSQFRLFAHGAADSWSLRVGHFLFMIPAEN